MIHKDIKINSWDDYWKLFDELIGLLKSDGQEQIVADFKDAQKYLNGLTDGWYEFKFAFEKSLNNHRIRMSDKQTDIADFLIIKLNQSLTNR